MQVKIFSKKGIKKLLPYTGSVVVTVLVIFASLYYSKKIFKANEIRKIEKDDLVRIKEKDKIVALTLFSKSAYFIYKGQPLGFEYELIKDFAKYLKVDLELTVVKTQEELMQRLAEGEGDIAAYGLTVNSLRRKDVLFSDYLTNEDLVVVQRASQNWKILTDSNLIKDIYGLNSKNIYVKRSSPAYVRLKNLEEEIGDSIHIKLAPDSVSIEDLINDVAKGTIDYTIANRNIASFAKQYYENLDINTPVSLPLHQAWAFNHRSPKLAAVFNQWLDSIKSVGKFYVLYNKYFNNSYQKDIFQTIYYSYNSESNISPYDSLIKKAAAEIGWDWRLVASLIYQESRFNQNARSSVGAIGLMQVMPFTSDYFGNYNLSDPFQNIEAGCKYLKFVEDKFSYIKDDSLERRKFVIAAHNIGYWHIKDAVSLAAKYGFDTTKWDNNVADMLIAKSKFKYYSDPVVKLGYVDGAPTVMYVKEVMDRFKGYRQLIK